MMVTGRHMLSEIEEQPQVLRRVASGVASQLSEQPLGSLLGGGRPDRVVAVGNGSSFHAALALRAYLEGIAGIPSDARLASEAFRHQERRRATTLAVLISHSGKSADVRAASRRAARLGLRRLAMTNVAGSPLAKGVELALESGAGSEKAIPSTKGFTAMVAACFLLATHLACQKRAERRIVAAARQMEAWLVAQPARDRAIDRVAQLVTSARACIFIGGDILYPLARDAALKLMEVTYLPALAYTPEELRHGPVALVDENVAVILMTPVGRDPIMAGLGKDLGGAGARLIVAGSFDRADLPLPQVERWLTPIVWAPGPQLLAHRVGISLGRPVDRPRGLVKVVTDRA